MQIACAPGEGSYQPALSHIMIRIFTERILDDQCCKVFFFHVDNEDSDQTVRTRRLI